ncbi:MAG TPA: NADH-quinone oxidoreductase subunit C [Thermodesulfobacteriota bacterium]|nr:NADH-quinone oxidoreductase subunit C [Thermodesulfobacteriota bacterium]
MDSAKELLIINTVRARFGTVVSDAFVSKGEINLSIDKGSLLDVCRFLKSESDLQINYVSDICGVDYHPETPRFEVVYNLVSVTRKIRLRLKTRLSDGETIDSVTAVWRGADWPERETYDMYGIVFDNHPNLKRIYMPKDWEGFPLRKDYPLKGYKDQYNPFGEEKKK